MPQRHVSSAWDTAARVKPRILHDPPCDDTASCLWHRGEAFARTPNLTLDARREIPCQSCRRGVERERAAAAVRKPSPGAGERLCSVPHCDRKIGPNNKTGICWRCADVERSRIYYYAVERERRRERKKARREAVERTGGAVR